MIEAEQHSAAGGCCPHCGAAPSEPVIRRGAIMLTSNPDEVFWSGRRVPLSPTEAHLFRLVVVRGRATYQAIDEAMVAFGSNPATRSVVMLRIRQKFIALGGDDPFIRLGNRGVRLNLGAEPTGSSATVIGLEMPAGAIAELAYG